MPSKPPTPTTDVVTRAVRDLQRDPPPRTPLTGTQVVAGAAPGNRERNLVARPDCAVCGRPVESFTEEVQEHVQYVVFTARCHGASERVRVEREVVEYAGPGGVRFGLAFVPPNALPAAPAPKLLEAPLGQAAAAVACDKSSRRDPCTDSPTLSAVSCGCGKVYARCSRHGGEAGARRSLHSHRALYHPKEEPT